MLSTYSIRSAFSLLYPGARGETAAEIAAVMGFDADSDRALTAINAADLALGSRNLEADDANELEAVELHTANAFWSQTGAQWSDIYLDALAVHLGAPVYATNFAADPEASRATINGWVEDQTRERIKDLLPDGSITAGTAAVLTNAVYFKAPWATKFEKEFTRDADFRRLDGSTVSVPTMAQAGHVGFVRGDGYSAAELPFQMVILRWSSSCRMKGSFESLKMGLPLRHWVMSPVR
jgi:serpin B